MPPSEIRREAREALRGKWGKGVCIVLAWLLIVFLISLVTTFIPILQIAELIITPALSFGLVVSFIKLARNEDVKAFDFWENGFSRFGKAWGIAWHTFIRLIIPIILIGLIMFVFSFMMIYNSSASLINTASSAAADYKNAKNTEEKKLLSSYEAKLNSMTNTSSDYSSSSYIKESSLPLVKTTPTTTAKSTSNKTDLSWLYTILFVVLFIAALVYSVAKSLLYVLAHYISYDNPELSSKECVIRSAMLMKGKRGDYFILSLSFIAWMILATLPLYLGYLWLLPYMQVTMVCFYDKLIKQNSNTTYEEEINIEE